MHSTDFLIQLRQSLAESDCPVAISSLRQDPLVWESLKDAVFAQKVFAFTGNQVKNWNPGNLAFLSLFPDGTVDDLESILTNPLEPELRQKAILQFEKALLSGQCPSSLDEACLLALALKERRRLRGSWSGLSDELSVKSKDTPVSLSSIWSTPIACTYSFVPDSAELLRALFPDRPSAISNDMIGLCIHAILSSPLTPGEQLESFISLLDPHLPEVDLQFLSQLELLGRKELVNSIATALLTKEGFGSYFYDFVQAPHGEENPTSTGAISTVDPLSCDEPLQSIEKLRLLSAFYRFAGDSSHAKIALDQAKTASRRLEARIVSCLAADADAVHDYETAISGWEKVVDLVPETMIGRTKLAGTLLSANRAGDAVAVLPANRTDLQNKITEIKLAMAAGEIDRARSEARGISKISTEMETSVTHDYSPLLITSHPDMNDVLRTLINLDLAPEAVKFAEKGLSNRFANQDFMELSVRAYIKSKLLDDGVETSLLAMLSRPDDLKLHRLVAEAFEVAHDYAKAFGERQYVLDHTPEESDSDLLALGSDALQINQPEIAISLSESILQKDPENGLAHSLIGEARLQKQDVPGAIDEFTQATALVPEQAGPWLALSRSLVLSGERQRSLEVLRSAAHAVPQSSAILFALGQSSLESGYPSEAIPPLREAFALDNQSADIALTLGQTLYRLGHYEEANQALATAREFNINHPDLGFLHGQILLVLNSKAAAFKALVDGTKGANSSIEPFLLLAQTLASILAEQREIVGLRCTGPAPVSIISSEDYADVASALINGLRIDPDNFLLKLLLAETYDNAGDDQAAYDIYVKLSEDPSLNDPSYCSRIQFGLGKVSTRLGQVETGVASLEEAASVDPDNLDIHQSLVDALRAANLDQEALDAARLTLRLAPDNLRAIIWFAKVATSLDALPEVANALERGLIIAPERIDFLVWLAEVRLHSGEIAEARKYLSQLMTTRDVSVNEYRKASSLLFQIEDFQTATTCLERATKVEAEPIWPLYFELAVAYGQVGKYSSALDVIQKAVVIQTDNLLLCVMQADLLTRLNRNLAALACLEHAFQILETQTGRTTISVFAEPGDNSITQGLMPENLREITPARVHARFAYLLRVTGELRQALSNALEGLKLSPGDIEIRAQAVDLAYSLMEDNLALQLSSLEELQNQFFNPEFSFAPNQIPSVIRIASIQADLALEKGDPDLAKQLVARGLAITPTYPHLLALQARISLRNGDLKTASQLISQADANKMHEFQPYPDEPPSPENHTANDLQTLWSTLAIAEALLETGQWSGAYNLFRQASQVDPQLPRPHLSFARALVILAEKQETYQAIKITAHAPGEDKLGNDNYKRFEDEIIITNRLSANAAVNHWKTRGQSVFQPCFDTIKNLTRDLTKPEDVAALIAAYRRFGNLAEVQKLAEAAKDDPEVAFQMALAYRQDKPSTAITLVQNLLEKDPTNPPFIALLAFLSIEDAIVGKNLIELALSFWPDEIEWHMFAADLGTQIGDANSAIDHWEKIVTLKPDEPAYHLSLGKIYLEYSRLKQAIQVFEHTSRLDPDHLETWKLLAQSHQKAGNFIDARNAIDHAITIDSNDRESLVLSGQTALMLGENDLACERAKSILALNPSDPDALLLYAMVLKQTGQPMEALKIVDEALKVCSDQLPVLLEKAVLVKQTQGNQTLLPFLIDLTKSHPENPEVLTLLAGTFFEMGQMESAERTAQAALQLSPDDAAMHLLLGRIQRINGQLDQSLHHLDEAVRQTPSQIEAYLELGRTYQERREHVQALNIYRQASQVAPDDFRPFYQAGLALRESKDYIGAETMFRRAASLAPGDLNVRRQLGTIITLNLVHNPQEAIISNEQ